MGARFGGLPQMLMQQYRGLIWIYSNNKYSLEGGLELMEDKEKDQMA